MFGSHSAYRKATLPWQGEQAKRNVDFALLELVQKSAEEASQAEQRDSPASFGSRESMAKISDPGGQHRIHPTCAAHELSLTVGYVVDLHLDRNYATDSFLCSDFQLSAHHPVQPGPSQAAPLHRTSGRVSSTPDFYSDTPALMPPRWYRRPTWRAVDRGASKSKTLSVPLPLENALRQGTTEFTQEEWTAFIKSNSRYQGLEKVQCTAQIKVEGMTGGDSLYFEPDQYPFAVRRLPDHEPGKAAVERLSPDLIIDPKLEEARRGRVQLLGTPEPDGRAIGAEYVPRACPESITFLCTDPGIDSWAFLVAGTIVQLPCAIDHSHPGSGCVRVYIAYPDAVHHGTLPYVDKQGIEVEHGNIGSALVSKGAALRHARGSETEGALLAADLFGCWCESGLRSAITNALPLRHVLAQKSPEGEGATRGSNEMYWRGTWDVARKVVTFDDGGTRQIKHHDDLSWLRYYPEKGEVTTCDLRAFELKYPQRLLWTGSSLALSPCTLALRHGPI